MESQEQYKIGIPDQFTNKEKEEFLALLMKQSKVIRPSIEKINNCISLSSCSVNDTIVSIGAIKPCSRSDFDENKANLLHLRNDFDFEVGYCYTDPIHAGNGYSSQIVKLLIQTTNNSNIIASTETREDNPMIRILTKNGFNLNGAKWKSAIHGGELGLFMRVVNEKQTTQE